MHLAQSHPSASGLAIACLATLVLMTGILAGCAEDPQYLKRDQVLEAGNLDLDPALASDQFILPVRLETEEELMERQELQGLVNEIDPTIQVPLIGLNDFDISIEWTIKSLADTEGTARVHITGGNERFFYVPDAFVINPQEDEEPPPLIGDIPITVPAGGTVSGVFREDQVLEAALDLLLMASPALNSFSPELNPYAAIYQPHDDLDMLVGDAGLLSLPAELRDRTEELIPNLVQIDVRLEADRHMVLEYSVRVRDRTDMLHELLLDAPAEELSPVTPAAQLTPPAQPMQ